MPVDVNAWRNAKASPPICNPSPLTCCQSLTESPTNPPSDLKILPNSSGNTALIEFATKFTASPVSAVCSIALPAKSAIWPSMPVNPTPNSLTSDAIVPARAVDLSELLV